MRIRKFDIRVQETQVTLTIPGVCKETSKNIKSTLKTIFHESRLPMHIRITAYESAYVLKVVKALLGKRAMKFWRAIDIVYASPETETKIRRICADVSDLEIVDINADDRECAALEHPPP